MKTKFHSRSWRMEYNTLVVRVYVNQLEGVWFRRDFYTSILETRVLGSSPQRPWDYPETVRIVQNTNKCIPFFFLNVITGVLDLVHITVLPNAEHTVRVVLLVLNGMTTRYISYDIRKTILDKVHLMHVIFMWLKLLRTLKLKHSLKVTWKKMQKFVFFRWFIFV